MAAPWVLAEFPDEIEEDDAIFRIRFTGEVVFSWHSLAWAPVQLCY